LTVSKVMFSGRYTGKRKKFSPADGDFFRLSVCAPGAGASGLEKFR